MPRVPVSCPVGYNGRYVVVPGDSFYRIAQIFRTDMNALIRANPHISNPAVLFPGDVLCVPGQIPFPCCILLQPVQSAPLGTIGTALAHIDFQGTQSVSVLALLPQLPSSFDTWVTELTIPDVGTFGIPMYATPAELPVWSASISLPTAAVLTPNSVVVVRPMQSNTGQTGPIVLQGSLLQCDG